MPLVTLDDCPVGLSLLGAPGTEDRLLAVARTIAG
jgi:Asp-tRNA(Asn)/Glu-tRNA(Gln) amidotransferase A subunit family amidase